MIFLPTYRFFDNSLYFNKCADLLQLLLWILMLTTFSVQAIMLSPNYEPIY